mmetsp:Transcript_52304/g.67076  ORF Transcript_52304/g.67076 Transcript_52304/m.67076 type:complete len:360 (+) Transcript_52304:105-1184(+)
MAGDIVDDIQFIVFQILFWFVFPFLVCLAIYGHHKKWSTDLYNRSPFHKRWKDNPIYKRHLKKMKKQKIILVHEKGNTITIDAYSAAARRQSYADLRALVSQAEMYPPHDHRKKDHYKICFPILDLIFIFGPIIEMAECWYDICCKKETIEEETSKKESKPNIIKKQPEVEVEGYAEEKFEQEVEMRTASSSFYLNLMKSKPPIIKSNSEVSVNGSGEFNIDIAFKSPDHPVTENDISISRKPKPQRTNSMVFNDIYSAIPGLPQLPTENLFSGLSLSVLTPPSFLFGGDTSRRSRQSMDKLSQNNTVHTVNTVHRGSPPSATHLNTPQPEYMTPQSERTSSIDIESGYQFNRALGTSI